MTPRFAARRNAEEFNSLVEGTSTQQTGAARYADTLELVESLRGILQVEPRPEFVADLRRQLMAEAATVLTPTAARLTVTPRRNPRERRIAIAIGGFAVVSATTSMAMAAQTALPGETLYPLKRALENASTTIQVDEDAKGASMLAHAAGRLAEVDELTQQDDDANVEAVADTLRAFAEQASTASELMIAAYDATGHESDIEELRSFVASSMVALNDLEAVVPEDARAALIEAVQVMRLIDTEAIEHCPGCGEGGAQTADFDPASVNDVLDDLGGSGLESLEVPGPVPTPEQTKPGAETGTGPRLDESTDESTEERDGDKPDAPVETPQAGTGGVDTNDPTGGNAAAGGGGNAIKDLTDKLTGAGGTRDTSGGLDDVLDGFVGSTLGK